MTEKEIRRIIRQELKRHDDHRDLEQGVAKSRRERILEDQLLELDHFAMNLSSPITGLSSRKFDKD